MDEKSARRAGLDYWSQLELRMHEDWAAFETWATSERRRLILITKFAKKPFSDFSFQERDVIVFGNETSGAPEFVHERIHSLLDGSLLRIPMGESCRSLNLSNAVAIVLYEGLRQLGYPHLA